MQALNRAYGFISDTARRASTVTFGAHSFRVYLSNTSDKVLTISQQPAAQGTSHVSFSELEPGEVGFLSVSDASPVGCSLSVEFTLGEDRILIAMANTAVNSRLSCNFNSNSTLQSMLAVGSKEVLGAPGARCLAEGKTFAAHFGGAHIGAHIVANVLVGPKAGIAALDAIPRPLSSRSCLVPGLLESDRLMDFAVWRSDEGAAAEEVAQALFLAELSAVQASLQNLNLHDRTYALDLLVASFLASGLVKHASKQMVELLKQWQSKFVELQQRAGHKDKSEEPGVTVYEDYQALSAQVEYLQAHLDMALLTAKAAALQSAQNLRHLFSAHDEGGSVLEDDSGSPASRSSFGFSPSRRASMESVMESNAEFMLEHLQAEEEEDAASLSSEVEKAVVRAAQQCIHETASFCCARDDLFKKLIAQLPSEGLQSALGLYRQRSPPTSHHFSEGGSHGTSPSVRSTSSTGGKAGGATEHRAWCSELLGTIDGGMVTGAQRRLASLGHSAPSYKVMSTNSKSGEFFFFSADRGYIIKTVSKDEAELLIHMLPAYQAHLRRTPKSFLVRFAGVHQVKIPNIGETYFTVMASIFDNKHKVHERFDVKGSMLNRKAKAGESCMKDEDWVSKGHRLELSDYVRREVRAIHEQDAHFLARFEVMDYSLLIGIHHAKEDASGSPSPAMALQTKSGGGWREHMALVSENGEDIYFVGMIDFLIGFGIKKKAEHVLRTAQGHGTDASCVDPMAYATRQVEFVQESVLGKLNIVSSEARRSGCPYGSFCQRTNPEHKSKESHPGDPDWEEVSGEDEAATGCVGMLRVVFIKAKNLINADMGLDLSDPYAVAGLGLQSKKTQTIDNNLNPEWNCTVRLAVDDAHLDKDIELSIWDEDHIRSVQGDDDFLGRVRVPLKEVMDRSSILIKRKLDGVKTGELHARLDFISLESIFPSL